MKVQTFDKNEIRRMMESSPALEKGIKYYKFIDPKLTDAQAKECAIRDAMDRTSSMWYNDSTGHLRNEAITFHEFEKDVANNLYFYDSEMKKAAKRELERKQAAEKRKQYEENNRKRIADLKEYCKENNLNFDEENIKQLKKLKKTKTITDILSLIFTLIMFASIVIGIYYFFVPDSLLVSSVGFGICLAVLIVTFFILGKIYDKSPHYNNDIYEILKK